jgi:hypothetical protein
MLTSELDTAEVNFLNFCVKQNEEDISRRLITPSFG